MFARHYSSALFLYIAVFSLAILPLETHAAAPCVQANEVEIKTPEERAQATAAGIPTSSPCWDPKSRAVGKNVGQVKQELKKYLCPGRSDYGGYSGDETINRLNGDFATCANRFLAFARNDLGMADVCINEAARTVERQNSYVQQGKLACTKGIQCEHPSGIAIDVNTKIPGGYQKLFQNSCQFGLVFYLGMVDPYHFVPTSNRVGKDDNIKCPQVVGNCLDPNFRPTDMGTSVAPPSSALSNAIRQALNVPTQAPIAAYPQQPVAATQSPINSFAQATPIMTTPTTATPTSGSEASGVDFSGINGTPTATGTSLADKLAELAFGVKATTSTSTGSSIPLIINGNDRSDRVATVTPTSTIQTAQTWAKNPVQNTFVAQDLAWTNSASFSSGATENSSFARILSTIQNALMQLLSRLRPFGTRSLEYAE